MEMESKKGRYIKEKRVGDITGYGLQTLRNHRYRGVGIPYVKIGRAVRYLESDVYAYMEARKIRTREF